MRFNRFSTRMYTLYTGLWNVSCLTATTTAVPLHCPLNTSTYKAAKDEDEGLLAIALPLSTNPSSSMTVPARQAGAIPSALLFHVCRSPSSKSPWIETAVPRLLGRAVDVLLRKSHTRRHPKTWPCVCVHPTTERVLGLLVL